MVGPDVLSHWQTSIEGFSTSSLGFYDLVKEGISRREVPDLKVSEVEWKESGLGSGKRVYLRISREGLNFDICAAPFGKSFFFSWWLAVIPRVLLDFIVLGSIALLGCFALGMASLASLFGVALMARQSGFGLLLASFGMGIAPVIFFGVILGLGYLVRFREPGWETAVLSMPITGAAYRFLFRPTTYFSEDTSTMFRDSVHQAVLEAVDAVTSAHGVRALTDAERRIPEGKPKGSDLHLHLT